MATQTRSGRVGRSSAQTGGAGRFARASSTPRRSSPTAGLRRRREPQPTGLKKVAKTVLPTKAAKKAAPTGKAGKAGGVALLAAAAGVAFKNRDKIVGQVKQRVGGDGSSSPEGTTATTNSTPPATPIA